MSIIDRVFDGLVRLHEAEPPFYTSPEIEVPKDPNLYRNAIISAALSFGGVELLDDPCKASIEDLDFENLNSYVLMLLKDFGIQTINNPYDIHEQMQHADAIDCILTIVSIKWRICAYGTEINPPYIYTDVCKNLYTEADKEYVRMHNHGVLKNS